MHRQAAVVANRLSLRHPQRSSLEILDRLCELVPPRKNVDLAAALTAVRGDFPTVSDFERDFPSLCFALATGVGKTRLMGAFISYLHTAHGIRNFFVLAPNLTIYNKLITDFTPNTPKYVFMGIAEFATSAPAIITGDNYEALAGPLLDQASACKLRLPRLAARPRADHGRVASLPGVGRRAGHQRAEADPWLGAHGHAVRGRHGQIRTRAVQERGVRLPPRARDHGWLREEARRCDAEGLQRQGDDARRG